LAYNEPAQADEGLIRTIDWERLNPPSNVQSFELLDYETEDDILDEIGSD
jgi:hypothetical protein